MLRFLSVLTLTALAACAPVMAPGQSYPGGYPQQGGGVDYGRGAVRCESRDGDTRECGTGFRGRAELVENLSDTRCVEGRNWGNTGRGSIWVQGGCRGVFAEAGTYGGAYGGAYGGGQSDGRRGVRCESDDGRQRECGVPGRGRVELVRQLSDTRCIEGRNWGQMNGGVWVNQGCRGEFAATGGGGGGGGYDGVREMGGYGGGAAAGYGGGRSITCASEGGRTTTCAWDPRMGQPRLLEKLSDSDCREGVSWGMSGPGELWVSRGCRGRFGR